MPDIPGLGVDVYFGDAEKPLPEWDGDVDAATDEAAEDAPLSDDDRAALVAVLGFDPSELDGTGLAGG
jgi:hypothetical protein